MDPLDFETTRIGLDLYEADAPFFGLKGWGTTFEVAMEDLRLEWYPALERHGYVFLGADAQAVNARAFLGSTTSLLAPRHPR